MEGVQFKEREATDEIHRQPEHDVVEKSLPARPVKFKRRKKSLPVKVNRKANADPPAPPDLDRPTPREERNATEQETGTDSRDKTISGNGLIPPSTEGRLMSSGGDEFFLKQVDQPPIPTREIKPEFPVTARRLGIGGKVVVKFLVKADGNVARASIVEAEPKEIFEQSALKAIREWQFTPGHFHGEAVATWVVLPIQFRLTR